MIVLDEHLKGLGVAESIRSWYPGRVCTISELRPGTVIKDEAIPAILASTPGATFVSLDWNEAWAEIQHRHGDYSMVSLSLPTSRAGEVPQMLRALFRTDGSRSKAERRGHIFRIAADGDVRVILPHEGGPRPR